MKKSFSKRILSFFCALVLIATSIPFGAIVTPAATGSTGSSTEWTMVASSDFTSTAGCAWNSTSNDSDFTQSRSANVSGDTTGVSLSWTGREYTRSTATVDEFGTHINDGYIYLSGSSTGQVPVKGLSAFKIDIGFSIDATGGEDALWNTDYCFLKLGTTSSLGKPSSALNSETVFTQAKSGKTYANSSALTTNGAMNSAITDQSAHMELNTKYRYVLTYVRGYLRGCITDEAGNLVQTIFGAKTSIDTNSIVSLTLGHASNAYMRNFCYRDIKFYSGVDTVNQVNKDPSRDKFLFAYFTGQATDEQEKLHFAVSSDGRNFEALNGNEPITTNHTPSEFYPAGGASMGMPASGHIRDPYIIQKRNPDGSIGKGYYVLATDLAYYKIGSYNNTKFLFWYVEDITDIDTALPWSVETTPWYGGSTASMDQSYDIQAWAPEAIWDDEKGMYMMFFSSSEDENKSYDNIRLHYAYTRDFKTFYNQKLEQIGVNGVKPDILYEPYFGGNASDNKAIDATILYNGEFYYMYFKNESKGQIYYATAEHANGPYSNYIKFSDSDYTTGLEGVELYQLNDNSYTLMMDYYKEGITANTGIFLTYPSGDLANGFSTSLQLNSTNINHLSPRHGAVTYISTEEYNALAEKFGKSTYNASGLTDNADVNDTLVARYFTNADVTNDATGHGFTLTNNNGTAVLKDGKATVQFTNGGAKVNAAGTSGQYAQINLGNMASQYDFNSKDGVTFDWYGYSNSTNYYGRFFEVSNAAPGSVPYSESNDYGSTRFAYYAGSDAFGSDSDMTTAYSGTYANGWHHFTVTLTKGYMNVYVDGALIRSQYNIKTAEKTKKGTPLKSVKMNESWFSDVFSSNGNLYFATSVFDDELLDGYISDFRIYNRALSQSDITASIDSLTSSDNGAEVNVSNRIYYDPMEDMDTTGDGNNDKTAYSATVNDPKNVHGNVLNDINGVQSKYVYNGGSLLADGFTVSTFYNPGASVSGNTVFNIGRLNSDNSDYQYFELLDNGYLYYNYKSSGTDHFIDVSDAFGTASLEPNIWYHIVVQIVPNGNYDIMRFYINGNLVKTVDTYTSSYNKGNLGVAGYSICDYFKQAHNVYYGKSCGYWSSASEDEYIDDFSIYEGIYSASSILKNDNKAFADKLMDEAIRSYTEKMASIKDNSKTVYTNMAQAYEVYDQVLRYKDATDPAKGGKEADVNELVALSEKMQNALNKMTEYSGPKTIEGLTSEQTKVGSGVEAKYTKNLLTPVELTTKYEQDGKTQYELNTAIFSSSFVWLYDGENTPTAPINGGVYKKDAAWKNTYNIDSIYIKSGDIAFGGLGYGGDNDRLWHVTTTDTDKKNSWFYNASGISTFGYTDNDTSHRYEIPGSKQVWYGASNYLTYTGEPNNTDIYTEFTPIYGSQGYRKWTGGTGTYDFSISPGLKIGIINYVPIRNELTSEQRLDKLATITSYSPESVRPFLKAYDDLTSQDYIISSFSNVGNLEETLSNNLKALTDQSLEFTPKADYSGALQEVVDNTEFYNSITVDSNGSAVNADGTAYTTSSWIAYDNAYNAIREHFASLDPTDENQSYATEQATVDRLKNNIAAAKNVLVERADYSSVESGVTSATVLSNLATNNTDSNSEQLFTYTSWTEFTKAYDSANAWATKSTAYKNDTEKYVVTYVQTDQAAQQNKNMYGPFIAYDASGKVVTSDSQVIDHYEFIGVFYENDGDAQPSQFETGDYVLIDGQYIKLNYHRYYATAVDTSTESTRQVAIKESATNLDDKNSALGTAVGQIGDYQNYNYSQDLAALADKDAYGDNGQAIQANVETYGLENAPVAYTGTAGTPYIIVDGKTYKDANQSEVDIATADVLNTINSNKKTYNVTFNVYVDGAVTTQSYVKTYGDVVTLNAVSVNPAVADCVIAKTTISNNDANGSTVASFINSNSTVLERRIQKNTTVDMYFVSKVDGAKLVKVQDYFGCPLDAGFVMPGETISVDNTNKTISYTDAKGIVHNVSARISANYTFNYFALGGAEASASVTVGASDITFTQNGTKSGNMTYSANDGTVNGVDSISDVSANTQLTFVANDTTNFLVWVKTNNLTSPSVGDWYIASYQPTFKTFSADEGFVYQVVTNDNWSTFLTQAQYNKVTEKLPFSFGTAANLVDNKFRMYCDFTYDSSLSNVVIVEAGAVYSTTANDDSTLYKGGTNCRTVAANSINYDTNTYTITKSNAGTGNHYMRSYVSFTYTTTIDGVETTIPRVVYGPVVKCENGSIVK